MSNVVFLQYVATVDQRVDALRTAAYLIEQNGYTPQQVNTSDERLTLTDALTYASRRYSNPPVAWNDLMFLVNARLANQGVSTDGFQAWCWEQSWLTITNWLVRLADMVQDSAR